MSAHVLGLDLGLAHVGAAQLHADGRVHTWHLQTDPARCVDGHDRCGEHHPDIDEVLARLDRCIRWSVGRATPSTVLAVIEGPAHAAQHGQPHERAGVWWGVARALRQHEIPVAVLSPSTVKGWMTGDGTADKDRMRRAVAAAWPDRGLRRITDHEADAVALAGAGANRIGWPGPWLEGRSSAGWLRKAHWPADLDDLVAARGGAPSAQRIPAGAITATLPVSPAFIPPARTETRTK